MTPDVAQRFLDRLNEKAEVAALPAEGYFSMIQRLVDLGLKGGIVFDAVIVAVAEMAKVDHIVTFNARHFRRLCPKNPEFIIVPD